LVAAFSDRLHTVPFVFPAKAEVAGYLPTSIGPAGWVELLPNGVNCLNPKHVGKLMTILGAAAVNLVQSVLLLFRIHLDQDYYRTWDYHLM
jgi:hypothetical protein